jgi:hypothetical protein
MWSIIDMIMIIMVCGIPDFLCTPSVTICGIPESVPDKLFRPCLFGTDSQQLLLSGGENRTDGPKRPDFPQRHLPMTKLPLATGKNYPPNSTTSPLRALGPLALPFRFRLHPSTLLFSARNAASAIATTTAGRRPADPASTRDLFHLRRILRCRAASTALTGLRPVGLWQPVDSTTSSSATCGSVAAR